MPKAASSLLNSECRHYQVAGLKDVTCSICVRELEEGELGTELPCGHWFHSPCIESWFSNRTICPNCREVPQRQADPA